MKNPWLRLPQKPPFVLPEDVPYVAAFNRTASATAHIHTDLMPAPFLGAPASPVVVLALNPGWSPEDPAVNRDPHFRTRVRENLEHRRVARPFVPLDGDPERPGARWWRKNLKAVLAEVGEDSAARHLCCLEFFPYHSISFAHALLRLPSQDYTFDLLRAALRRKSLVVITRGLRYWMGAVPELVRYRNVVRTGNARIASISPRNCGSDFNRIVRRLRRAAV